MANPNEIEVDLRLKLDKLKGDTKEATKEIDNVINKDVKTHYNPNITSGVDARRKQAADELRKMRASGLRGFNTLEYFTAQKNGYNIHATGNQFGPSSAEFYRQKNGVSTGQQFGPSGAEFFRRQNAGFATGEEHGPDLGGAKFAAAGKKLREDLDKFIKNIGFGALPIMNPTSAIGNFAAARQSFKAFSGTQAGAAYQAKMGLPAGTGGAVAAAGMVTAAAIAVGLALKGLEKIVELTSASFERANKFYAKQLQSGGMAGGFIIQRSLLAEVMGVSENDVMQYGMAIGSLNEKLSGAVQIFSETNSVLTATAWNIQTAKIAFEALGASIATAFAPVVNEFANMARNLADLLANSEIVHTMFEALSAVLFGVESAIKMVVVAGETMLTMWDSLAASLDWINQKINNFMASLHVPGFTKDNSDVFKNVKKEWEDIAKTIKGEGNEKAPGIPVSTQRMPASAWEKMGLVLGNVGGNDHAKQTAQNTKKTADKLDTLIKILTPARSGSWGTLNSPSGAQP